ncbi:MAG: ABC transporter ATP-binding protein [Ktedonobacterales bacterium]|nr:ABC transporter ATP-binding protein [Ktedonobacterales bacterium]
MSTRSAGLGKRKAGLGGPLSRLGNLPLAGRPLKWYVTGWRGSGALLVLALLFPQFYGNGGQLLLGNPDESLVTTGILVGIYVLLALGLNIVVGYAGLLDLGYVAFYVIGAYTVGVFTDGRILAADGRHAILFQKTSFWIILPLAALLAGIFGVLLGAPTLRLRGDYLAIVTLGFGEIVPIFFQNLPYFGRQDGLSANGPPDVGPVVFSDPLNNIWYYYLTLTFVVIIIFVVKSLRDSSLGRAWIAIREDETAAAASGVNLVRTKLLAFGLGAVVGGLGGGLFAGHLQSIATTNFNFQVSITVLAMIVLGGIGSIPGVIVGAIALAFFDQYLLGKVNDTVHQSVLVQANNAPLHFLAGFDFNFSKYLIYGLLLMIMILLRPQGLIPNIRRQRELKGIGASPEGASAVGLLEREEAGETLESFDAQDTTTFGGPGSDAQGREG